MDINEEELIKIVTAVTTEFYEIIYDDPWFQKIFRNKGKEIITSQQIDFMVGALGGPKKYNGRHPKDAHPQIWVNEDIWNYRENILIQAFNKCNAPEELREKWLKIDNALKGAIVNTGGPDECVGRFNTDEIIYEPMPEFLKKKAS